MEEVSTILTILSEALDDPTLMPGGGMLDSRAGLLRKTQALMCMELAGFDAVPHEMLVDIVHSLLAGEPSLCVDVLASFRLLGKIKDTDPKTLTQVCADALTLGKHEDWRCRVAFLGNLDFIFEQLTDADPELLKETTVMEANHVAATEKLSAPTQGNPDVWEAFKGVVDAAMWDEVAEARIQFVAKLPSLVGCLRLAPWPAALWRRPRVFARTRPPSFACARRATALIDTRGGPQSPSRPQLRRCAGPSLASAWLV